MELNNNNNNNNIDSSSTSSLLPPLTSSTTSSSSSTISSNNTTITCTSNMICSFCFTEKKNMPVCAQCKIQIYCSTKCLKQDRQRHFILCQKYQDY
ncbi:hypothetical protein BJ944DRAFT_265391 [Cunninghamella echinulata]|nr:hypothetical protein BJ944DRAFT_265391 [Cunninghamella echinulata]